VTTLTRRLRRAAGVGLRRSPQAVQDAVRRSSITLLRVVSPADLAKMSPPETAPLWESPPVPVPDGSTLAEIEKSFWSWSVNGEPPGHLDGYVDNSIWRFMHTWGIVRDETGTCLELGANPYFTTYLVDQHTDLDLTLANYFGPGEQTVCTETVSFVPPGGGDRVEVVRNSQTFNIEQNQFPFDADSFDVVLFCEILEHLVMDPLSVLREIHRVLKSTGVVVLTTPNACRLDNVFAMVAGANIYDEYSGYGPYGRHNREYNRHELHRLLDFAGFEVEYSFTADGHAADPRRWPAYDEVGPLIKFRRPDLGEYVFVRARPVRPPRDHLPSFLYRSRPPGEIVTFR
jgi:SAM-dependent methyltransferase